MNEEISDSRLKTFWQKWLHKHPEYHLPNLKFCGARIIKQLGSMPGVFVVKDRNSSETKFFGNTSCHSAWACPKCTAEVMAKKAKQIAAAIDALKKQQNQDAIMITFTIPHNKNISCQESYEIFLAVWRKFTKGGLRSHHSNGKYILKNDKGVRGKKGGNLGVGKAGEVRIYKKGRNPYGAFREELQITHNVRVFEFTYGENSWHPHIHALFWVPHKNFDKVLNYEQELLDRWWHCIKTVTKQYWTKKLPPEKLNNFLEKTYSDYKKTTADGHKSLYISRDKDNKLRKISSSWYIAGWGGDKEVSGLRQKEAHGKNMTPYQIILKAYTTKDPEEKETYLKLYAHYAQTTYKHRRCQFSETGITKIIREWLRTQEYTETYKKKVTDKEKNWEVVYWFTEKQWYAISLEEMRTGHYIRDDILFLARAPDAEKHIKLFLETYGIHTNNNEHTDKIFVENYLNHKTA